MFLSFEFFLVDLLILLPSPSQTKIKTGLLHPSFTFRNHSSAISFSFLCLYLPFFIVYHQKKCIDDLDHLIKVSISCFLFNSKVGVMEI